MEKFTEYAAFGARYYWIVDPALRMIELYELDGRGRYVRVGQASSGALGGILGCEDLVLDLDELWARVDRLCAEEDAETESDDSVQ
jgi:Uma2 family endonuclease